jgi:predicted nuclease of predicted toxin-antitoxin system
VKFALESARSAADGVLFALAHVEGRVLLTDDLDFGHITKTESLRPPAVVIARLAGMRRDARIRRVLDVLASIEASIEGQIVVIEPGQTRLRPMERL